MEIEHINTIPNTPVSIFLAVSIIVIFSLYLTTAIKTLPCGNDIMSIFFSNFVHVEPYHLLANLFALYALSRVEQDVGAKKFIGLVIFLLIFNTLVETILHKIFPQIKCSIGLSGVLFGIMSWEIVTKHDLDFILLISIAAMVILPSIQNSKISIASHGIGALAGIIGGLVWKKLGTIV